MVFGKFVTEEKDMELVQEICRKVFMEELGLKQPGTAADAFCLNALVFAGDQPAGAGRILFDGERFTIADVAVLPEYRGAQYGDFLVRLLIDKALMSNAQEIYLDARQETGDFFEKIGFQKMGEAFESFGGMWQPMVLRADQIHRCCDCGH